MIHKYILHSNNFCKYFRDEKAFVNGILHICVCMCATYNVCMYLCMYVCVCIYYVYIKAKSQLYHELAEFIAFRPILLFTS